MRITQRLAPNCATARDLAVTLGTLLALLTVSWSVAAQVTAPTRPAAAAWPTTRLGELYAQVQGGNPKASASQALVRAAQARVPGARRPPDPQLQLGFMNYRIPGRTPMDALGMTQLQLMQMMPLGGKLALAGRVASAVASATDERARDVEWELRNQTAMAFYELYATDRQLEVARETLRLLQDIG